MYRIAYVFDTHTSGKIIQELKKMLPTSEIDIQIDFFWQSYKGVGRCCKIGSFC